MNMKINKRKLVLRNIMLTILNNQSSKFNHAQYSDFWSKFEKQMNHHAEKHGNKSTIEMYKGSYIFLRNYILDIPTPSTPWEATDANNIPKRLWPLRPLLKGNDIDKRYALIIARMYENLRTPVDPKLEAIGTPLPEMVTRLLPIFKEWLLNKRLHNPWYFIGLPKQGKIPNWSTHRNGPNGPALVYSGLDALYIQVEHYFALKGIGLTQNETIYYLISQLSDAIGCEKVQNLISATTPHELLQTLIRNINLGYTYFDIITENSRKLFKEKSKYNNPVTLDNVKVIITVGHINPDDNINSENFRIYFNGKKLTHSKLSHQSEDGGKTRTFAMVDYFSQRTLKPLHDTLMKQLKKIRTDSTSDQEGGFNTILERGKGFRTDSFDLTSASDLIPVLLTESRYRLSFGDKVASMWSWLVTHRLFTDPRSGKLLKWLTGQPLGSLASFPSFTLTHHDIVQFSAWLHRNKITDLNGLNILIQEFKKNKDYPYEKGYFTKNKLVFFRNYQILGDDNTFWDRKVAQNYKFVMECLGIPINQIKSISGSRKKNQVEFCKRIATEGKEKSSLSMKILR